MPTWPKWQRGTSKHAHNESSPRDLEDHAQGEQEHLRLSKSLKIGEDTDERSSRDAIMDYGEEFTSAPPSAWLSSPHLQQQQQRPRSQLAYSTSDPHQRRQNPCSLSLPSFSPSDHSDHRHHSLRGLNQAIFNSSAVLDQKGNPRGHADGISIRSSTAISDGRSSPHVLSPLLHVNSVQSQNRSSPRGLSQPSLSSFAPTGEQKAQEVLTNWKQLHQSQVSMQPPQQQQQQQPSQQGMLRAYMASVKAGTQFPTAAAVTTDEEVPQLTKDWATSADSHAAATEHVAGSAGSAAAAVAAGLSASSSCCSAAVQLGIGQGSTAQLGLHMADSLVVLNNKVTSAGRALEQSRSQNRLLQEQIEAMEAELSESQKYHETLEEEMGRLKVKLDQRGVDLLLLQGELQHAQEAASRQAAALAAKDAQLNATGDTILRHEALLCRLALLGEKAATAGQLASRAWQQARRDPHRSETCTRALQASIEVMTAVTSLREACLQSNQQPHSEQHSKQAAASPRMSAAMAAAAASHRTSLSPRKSVTATDSSSSSSSSSRPDSPLHSRSAAAAAAAAAAINGTAVTTAAAGGITRSQSSHQMPHAPLLRQEEQLATQQQEGSPRRQAATLRSEDVFSPRLMSAPSHSPRASSSLCSTSRDRGTSSFRPPAHPSESDSKQQRIQELKQLLLLHRMPPPLSMVRRSSKSSNSASHRRASESPRLALATVGAGLRDEVDRGASTQEWEAGPSWARGKHVTPRSHPRCSDAESVFSTARSQTGSHSRRSAMNVQDPLGPRAASMMVTAKGLVSGELGGVAEHLSPRGSRSSQRTAAASPAPIHYAYASMERHERIIDSRSSADRKAHLQKYSGGAVGRNSMY